MVDQPHRPENHNMDYLGLYKGLLLSFVLWSAAQYSRWKRLKNISFTLSPKEIENIIDLIIVDVDLRYL